VRNWNIAFLLPSLLAAMATLWLTYDLGRRLFSHRAGLWAAIGVLACAQFLYQAKRAQIEPGGGGLHHAGRVRHRAARAARAGAGRSRMGMVLDRGASPRDWA
jgi:cyanate permease